MSIDTKAIRAQSAIQAPTVAALCDEVDRLQRELAATRADAEVTKAALFQMQEAAKSITHELVAARANAQRLLDMYAGVYETLREFDVYGTGGDASVCAREVKMQLAERTTAVEERIRERDAARVSETRLREAIERELARAACSCGHLLHSETEQCGCDGCDCGLDHRPGVQFYGSVRITALRAALAASDGAWLEAHDARVGGEAAGRERALVYRELKEGALDGQLAEHDLAVHAKWSAALHKSLRGEPSEMNTSDLAEIEEHDERVRAAALEEAAHHFRHRATVAMELRTLVATPSAAPAPERALPEPASRMETLVVKRKAAKR